MPVSWQLELLGGARLRGNGVSVDALERKAAALLTYLALEGPTRRSRLAGLLWPEASEKQARTNLRQLLWKLKAYEDLVIIRDPLALGSKVNVDAAQLREAPAGTANLLNVRFSPLLAGLEYDDCPDFHE